MPSKQQGTPGAGQALAQDSVLQSQQGHGHCAPLAPSAGCPYWGQLRLQPGRAVAGQLLPRDVACLSLQVSRVLTNTAVDARCLAELHAGPRPQLGAPQTGVPKALSHTGRIICYSIS